VSFAGFELPLPAGTDLSAYDGRTIVLGIRPSDLEDADVRPDPALPTIEVTADVTEELGSEVNVLFGIDAPPISFEGSTAARDGTVDEGSFLLEGFPRTILCARVDARTRARTGVPLRLSIDPGRFHFFDPETGQAVPTREGAVGDPRSR